jgi:uncharacterized glyoxalase superfamily protein PhnB
MSIPAGKTEPSKSPSGRENYEAVDRAYAYVVSKGAVSVMEPTTEPWGQRDCYIADPEGTLVEIGSFVKG